MQGFHYVTLPKPGLNAERVQAGSLLQARLMRHSTKNVDIKFLSTNDGKKWSSFGVWV